MVIWGISSPGTTNNLRTGALAMSNERKVLLMVLMAVALVVALLLGANLAFSGEGGGIMNPFMQH